MKHKYYVISNENVGPNAQPLNERVCIYTRPGKTNSSHEERTEGWLGTTNDNAEYAHGEYNTIEEAIKHINEKWPRFIDCGDEELDQFETEMFGKEMIFRDNREVWNIDDYLYEYIRSAITCETTDKELTEMDAELEKDVLQNNIYIKGNVLDYITEYRNNLRN